MLLSFTLYQVNEYDKAHPQKYICVKSHTESEYVYGPTLKMDGSMGMGWHWEHRYVCDKEKINPEWIKLNG